MAPGLYSTDSVVMVHKLSCPGARGICLVQRLKLCNLHWQVDSLPLSHQGSPLSVFEAVRRVSYSVFVGSKTDHGFMGPEACAEWETETIDTDKLVPP